MMSMPFGCWLQYSTKYDLLLIFRFGSFEIFKPRDMLTGRAGPSVGLTDILNQLVDYVIENFYPEVRHSDVW